MKIVDIFIPLLSSVLPNTQEYIQPEQVSYRGDNLNNVEYDSSAEYSTILRKFSDSTRFLQYASHHSHKSHSSHRSHSSGSHYSGYTSNSTSSSSSEFTFSLKATEINATSVSLSFEGWHEGSIYLSQDNSKSCKCIADTPFWTFRYRTGGHVVRDLLPGTTYTFRLSRRDYLYDDPSDNSYKYDFLSDKIKVTTKKLSLQASDITYSSMKISWTEKCNGAATIFVNNEPYKIVSLEDGFVVISNLLPQKNYTIVLKNGNEISEVINKKTLSDPYLYNRSSLEINSEKFKKSLDEILINISDEISANYSYEKPVIYVLDLYSDTKYNILGRETALLLNELIKKSKVLSSPKNPDIDFMINMRDKKITSFKEALKYNPDSNIIFLCYGEILDTKEKYEIKLSVINIPEENVITVKKVSIPK